MKYRTIGSDPTTRREVSVLSLGAMLFGTVTDEATSYAILDRYAEAGGTFVCRATVRLAVHQVLRPGVGRFASGIQTSQPFGM